jgi:hypothetical protein
MGKRIRLVLGFVLVWIATAHAAPPVISNVHATQRAGTRLLDVWYNVSDSDSDQINISVRFTSGGSVVSAFSFTRDAGINSNSANAAKITWDAGSNWTGAFSPLTVTVTADDGHAQSVPASCPVAVAEQAVGAQTGGAGKLESARAAPNSRFTDHGDGTVTDNQTGLDWVQTPHSLAGNSGTMVWSNAVDFCNDLIYAGHSDWRLPSRTELMSLVDSTQKSPSLPAGHLFDVQNSHYWSSTPHAGLSGFAWYVNLSYGYVSDYSTALSFYVWPVRGKQ